METVDWMAGWGVAIEQGLGDWVKVAGEVVSGLVEMDLVVLGCWIESYEIV